MCLAGRVYPSTTPLTLLLGWVKIFCKTFLALLSVLTWALTITLSLRSWFGCLLVSINVWHVDYCLCSWQAHKHTLRHEPCTHTRSSAASLAMNPSWRHRFRKPSSSSQRGSVCTERDTLHPVPYPVYDIYVRGLFWSQWLCDILSGC